jgi:hypothetical protein
MRYQPERPSIWSLNTNLPLFVSLDKVHILCLVYHNKPLALRAAFLALNVLYTALGESIEHKRIVDKRN